MAAEIYGLKRKTKVSENKIIIRMLEIAQVCLAPFEDSGLRRIFREPWEIAKKRPGLVRQMRKQSQDRLIAIAATRLTAADKAAIKELAKKQGTSMSAIQRQTLERLLSRRE